MAPVSVVDYSGTTWTQWTASSSTNLTEVWGLWTSNFTNSTAATTQTVWLDWTGSSGPIVASQYGYRQPTPEETEERRREAEERAGVVALAKTKARQLLRDVLDRNQRRELERDGHFHVQTRDGERVYRLKPGSPPERVKGEDGVRWSYCIHPRESYPADDTAAALKLLIEADEDEFLRIANASRVGTLVAA